jgi:signal transduction protein with GAF and PtsI domain
MPVETSVTQIERLQRVSNVVNSDQGIESVLREMVSLTMTVTRSDACLVYLIDHATNEIVLRASQIPHDAEIGNVRMKIGEGVTGWVAARKSVVALPRNAPSDRRFRAFSSLQEDTYQAFLSVPLVDRGGIIGVLNVHHKEPHQHSSDEVGLALFIGEQMGGAIARARQAETLHSDARRMEMLAAVAEAISAESHLEPILDVILQLLAETLDSVVCSILLVVDKKKELTVSAALCSAPYGVHHMPVRMNGSPIETVIRKCHPIVIPNIHNETQYRYPELAQTLGVVSLLAAPLISQRRVIGSINIYTRDERSFSDNEVGFVKVVSGQAAVAIQNARLITETLDLKRSIEARKLIERAKGVLQVKYRLTEEEAFLRLRNESRRSHRSMRDLSRELVKGGGLKEPLPKQPR